MFLSSSLPNKTLLLYFFHAPTHIFCETVQKIYFNKKSTVFLSVLSPSRRTVFFYFNVHKVRLGSANTYLTKNLPLSFLSIFIFAEQDFITIFFSRVNVHLLRDGSKIAFQQKICRLSLRPFPFPPNSLFYLLLLN